MAGTLGEGVELVAIKNGTCLYLTILLYRNYQVDLRMDLISTK